MRSYIGIAVPDDLFTFFAELNAYKCLSCNHIIAAGMADVSKELALVNVSCATTVDQYGRPTGLVCAKCQDRFKDFIYDDKHTK